MNRKSLQETIVVVVVGTLAIGVFLGVVRVMAPGNSSQGESPPQAAETAPPAVEDVSEPAPPG
jgi:Na+/H+-dicarboxylate symporter